MEPDDDGILYKELSYQIMGIAYEIHNKFGPGHSEDIYERAMLIDLAEAGIPFERQKTFNVIYKGVVIGKYRADIVVDNKIILELKAVTAMNNLFKQQTLSYLKATGYHLGILINFGSKRVESVRIVN